MVWFFVFVEFYVWFVFGFIMRLLPPMQRMLSPLLALSHSSPFLLCDFCLVFKDFKILYFMGYLTVSEEAFPLLLLTVTIAQFGRAIGPEPRDPGSKPGGRVSFL